MFFKRTSSKPSETPASTPRRSEQSSSAHKSPYRPLRQDTDAIRLVRVCPAKSSTDAITCDLTEVAFQDHPQYEALSYTWGDVSVKKRITLNGVDFAVGVNLFDALHCLRGRGESGFFWIDALCVNQADLSERNKQLKLMSITYSRATSVMVSLGLKYAKLQTQLSKARSPSEKQMAERQLARDLIHDDYWSRLWTIHDIGHARKVQICYGTQTTPWNAFIAFIKTQDSRDQGPLELVRQLDQQRSGSRRLRDLLYAHRHALCKDPRDKIYGLIGLAVDARGFPMDYSKSLVEVWTDTMEFMNQQRMFERESDIISCGSLIKFLLMGTEASRFSAAQPRSSVIEEGQKESGSPKVFCLRGTAIGQIVTVGPSLKEVTASVKKSEEWNKTVWQNFRDDVDIARQEGDMLLQTVFSKRGKALEGLSFDNFSNVKWMDQTRSSSEQKGTVMGLYTSAHLHHPAPAKSANTEVTLFQMYRPSKRTAWRMGITSGQAQQGDIVFWVPGTKKAVLLRVEQRRTRDGSCCRMLQICGTAMVTQDVLGEEVHHEKRLNSFGRDEELTLRMDSSTIYALLPEGSQAWK